MKCAKEVMELWESRTETMYIENLAKMVDTVTERLFEQASKGIRIVPPSVCVYTFSFKGSPDGIRMVFLDDRKEAIPVQWNEFELALKKLCYEVKPIYSGLDNYIVTPNPSC